ncbi:SGNH/GDSL hydrolase family protein [Wenxinia saemankumensis]|uniref:Uncharacterized protein n=1 Tax=Wenxinia saemankumensis TaxID=1447782 RepID=A0A1M6A9V2_9RHOB|nr:DUF459 domain-containing protein [Wenxinia saemankumensis]SHI33238.1 hypothetical protein SAMN05444417_0315 [Wenxinia saemankumensis]
MMRPLMLLTAAATLVAACASDGRRANAQDMGLDLVSAEAAPPQTAATLRPGISAADPARLLVIGDSLADGFGQLLVQQAAARDLPIDVTNRGRVSTGLARADYYDWPENFAAQAAQLQPDIVVAHFGANDMQTILAPEGRTGYGTEAWEGAYRDQIRKILAVAAEAGAVIYWIGPGPDSHTNLNAHLARLNPVYEDEILAAGGTFFPLTWTAPNGVFERNVTIDGQSVAMRTADGSHFTGTGYRMVADRVFDALIERFPQLAPVPGGGVSPVLASVPGGGVDLPLQ